MADGDVIWLGRSKDCAEGALEDPDTGRTGLGTVDPERDTEGCVSTKMESFSPIFGSIEGAFGMRSFSGVVPVDSWVSDDEGSSRIRFWGMTGEIGGDPVFTIGPGCAFLGKTELSADIAGLEFGGGSVDDSGSGTGKWSSLSKVT